jgi:hypothetical protein
MTAAPTRLAFAEKRLGQVKDLAAMIADDHAAARAEEAAELSRLIVEMMEIWAALRQSDSMLGESSARPSRPDRAKLVRETVLGLNRWLRVAGVLARQAERFRGHGFDFPKLDEMRAARESLAEFAGQSEEFHALISPVIERNVRWEAAVRAAWWAAIRRGVLDVLTFRVFFRPAIPDGGPSDWSALACDLDRAMNGRPAGMRS